MTSAKKRPFRRVREWNDDWLAVPVGVAFAAVGALGLAGRLENVDPANWKDRALAAVFLVVGIGLAFFSVRRIVRRFRPPSREAQRREERIARIAGRLVAYAAGLAMTVGGLVAFVVFRMRALRPSGSVASRFEAFLWLPVMAFGIAILGVLPSPFPRRARPEDAYAPSLVPVPRARRLMKAFLPLFPGGIGVLLLQAAGTDADRMVGLVAGILCLAFGLFIGWYVVRDLAHNLRPFVRVDAPRGPVEPGRGIPVRLDIAPDALVGAKRLVARPFLVLFELDEKTPWLHKTPEGLPADDPAAWFGPPQLDQSNPAKMRNATFVFSIPDLRKFSRREGFNPLGDNVEWRLEILLFQSGRVCRESFRVQIARPDRRAPALHADSAAGAKEPAP